MTTTVRERLEAWEAQRDSARAADAEYAAAVQGGVLGGRDEVANGLVRGGCRSLVSRAPARERRSWTD